MFGGKLIALAALAIAVLGLAGAVMAAVSDDDEQAQAPPPRQTPAPQPTPAPPQLPAPDVALPRDPAALAAALATTTAALDAAIDRWRAEGDPAVGTPPPDVALLALHQQRIYRRLGDRRALARAALAAVPRPLRAEVRDNVVARRELGEITSVRRGPPPKIRIGPAEPADVLRRYYRAARRRFEVAPALLAAVNFVESAFGRLRNRSISGAQGPMQFIPATWRAYGLGGDVHDPRDAILGAANYLHASGAPADERGALYHYNPSPHYVEAIARYTRRIRADVRAFYAYYAWQVYVGYRRLTDPPA
jgi:membrane-bound lytic murein transglycosylase B